MIDRGLIATQLMHVDVELRGEFTRGDRQNALNRKVPRGDTHVVTDIDAERFLGLLISRLSGRSGPARPSLSPRELGEGAEPEGGIA